MKKEKYQVKLQFLGKKSRMWTGMLSILPVQRPFSKRLGLMNEKRHAVQVLNDIWFLQKKNDMSFKLT